MSDFGRNAIKKEIERAEDRRDSLGAILVFEILFTLFIVGGVAVVAIGASVFQFSSITVALIGFAISIPLAVVIVGLVESGTTPLILIKELGKAKSRVTYLHNYYEDYCKKEQEEMQNET